MKIIKFITCLSLLSVMVISGKASEEEPASSGGKRSQIVLTDTIIQYNENLNNLDLEIKGVSSIYFANADLKSAFSSSNLSIVGDETWIYFPNIDIKTVYNTDLSGYIQINKVPIKIGTNAEISRYYNGTIIKAKSVSGYSPVTLYDNKATAHPATLYTIYQGGSIPVGDNQLHSFVLKRGHMMTISENEDGTGASKVYAATDNHLTVTLGSDLQNKVSYIRILSWNYTTKRGFGGNPPTNSNELKTAWFYNWGMNRNSSEMYEYVPMAWGKRGADQIDQILDKKNCTHMLTFNEPDGADQANMTAQQALASYPQLLKLGLRMGSPACRENAWRTWLPEFVEGCKQKNYRLDFIAIHWYDWGNWRDTKDPQPSDIDAIINRFKKNIDNCYLMYKLPIWITEFNANKNRLTNVQKLFLEKAVKMLEEHPYVERYAYFEPFGDNGKRPGYGNFYVNGKLTAVGQAYVSCESKPANTSIK